MVLLNLNPLLEYDGYYILMDWLERPNLRSNALRWLGETVSVDSGRKADFTNHKTEIFYAVGTIVYSLFAAVLSILLYRHYLLRQAAQTFSSSLLAHSLGWFIGIGILALSLLAIAAQTRKKQN